MKTKPGKPIQVTATCKENCGDLTNSLTKLRIAAETYMAAVECYNENPWDRVNVRKYASAKDGLRKAIRAASNYKSVSK